MSFTATLKSRRNKMTVVHNLDEILGQHAAWLKTGGAEGSRANLSNANLSGADLSAANLHYASLSGATRLW